MLTDPFHTNRITSTIIGAAIRVHRATGPGLLESVYCPCLVVELQESGLSVLLQCPIPLIYRETRLSRRHAGRGDRTRGAEISRITRADSHGANADVLETLW